MPTTMMCPEIEGGIRVCVPADVRLLTPYVLIEQEDWFEDEIQFIRRFLSAGMNVIDVGANYGIYTLSAARLVGERGRVLAFEPSSRCRRFLEESIKANSFSQVEIVPVALGDVSGVAHLSLLENPELGSVSETTHADAVTEAVNVITLDAFLDTHGHRNYDFVKMDAEGYETRIIHGGRKFFSLQAPLVMYERVHGLSVDESITAALAEHGYSPYRLVPGLMVLAPATSDDINEFQPLNLFACKRETADLLRRRGLLVNATTVSDRSTFKGSWRQALYNLPYGQHLKPHWEGFCRMTAGTEYLSVLEAALDAFVQSRDPSNPVNSRLQCLYLSYDLFKRLVSGLPNFASRQCLARASIDIGARVTATQQLEILVQTILSGQPVDVHGPFLAVCERYEAIQPGLDFSNWLYSSVIEGFVLISAFSSYFRPEPGLLQALVDLGFVSNAMVKRRQLTRMCTGQQAVPERDGRLLVYAPDNRNPGFWRQDQDYCIKIDA
jgi:protein O-GlcNAc transferase